mmetsp:Transcript_17131/g.30740  ORF Transcript_17131/g.30740 Transcript_17131/m.30740 type:complete len:243 (-) Transcript_17131:287-1015(-)
MLSKTEWTQYGVCICFSAALAAIFGLGVSYLVAASENKHDSEVSDVEKIIDAWEEYRPVFQGLRVSIKLSDSHLMPPNDIVDFVFDDNDLDYNHLKYYTNATSFPQNYTFYVTRSREDHNEYNVTASILLEVAVLEDGTSLQYEDDVIVLKRVKNNANSKMCRINDLGYWNGTVSACYMTYRLTALCYVLNSTYQIEDGGCLDGDRTKVETLKWTSENTPKNTLPISSTVRSSYDPKKTSWT